MRVYKNVENIGLMTIVFIFCLEIITTTRLLINGSVWGGDCFIAMIMSMVVCYWVSDNMKHIVLTTVICIFIFMAGTYICGHLYSIDWDGNAYHKMAIGCLKNGWNPIYESAQSFVNGYFNDSKIDSCAIWIDHYGKASWIFAANIYALTGKIECGKVYQLLAMESLFCMAAPYMIRKGIKKWTAVMVSILLVVNPVSFVQIFSYYVDGFLFSYLFILILGLTRLLDAENREQRKITWLVIVCSMSVLANIKFTGLLYGGIYCVAYYILFSFYQWKRSLNLFSRETIWTGAGFFILAMISVGWIGFPAYIKNFLDHGSFTYPLTGSDIDIITGNSPRGFEGKSGMYKLFYGTFGRFGNIAYTSSEELPALKVPFFISGEEFVLPGTDMRISGFGLLFSGILIVSLGLIFYYFVCEKDDKRSRIYFGMNMLLIASLTLFISDSWWARYAPYLYLTAIFAVVIFSKLKYQTGWQLVVRKLVILIIFLNNLYFVWQPADVVKRSPQISYELHQLSGSIINLTGATVSNFPGKLFDFEDADISFSIVDEIREPDGCCYYEPWEYAE